MEKNDEAVLTRIGEEFGNQIGELVARCIIKSVNIDEVDEDNNVAKVSMYEGDDPLTVPLQLLNIGEAVIKVIPTVDTTALIAGIDGNINRPFFVAYSQIDKADILIGDSVINITTDEINVQVKDSTINMTSDEIKFNGGENNGLVLAQNLCDRLNTIENDINTLKQAFTKWVPAAQDGGAMLKKETGAWAGQTLQQTKVSDVENDKIIQ